MKGEVWGQKRKGGYCNRLPDWWKLVGAGILGNQAAASKSETFDYPSLYERFLGKAGKWVAVLANMIILYGLLTAYFQAWEANIPATVPMGAQINSTVFAACAAVFTVCSGDGNRAGTWAA